MRNHGICAVREEKGKKRGIVRNGHRRGGGRSGGERENRFIKDNMARYNELTGREIETAEAFVKLRIT